MNRLGEDLIRLIATFLTFKDLLNFSISNRSFYNSIDDTFFKNYAYQIWSHLFWKLASQRNIKVSRPLSRWKYELLRIENYQKFLELNNIKRWTQKDFYNYWKFDYYSPNHFTN